MNPGPTSPRSVGRDVIYDPEPDRPRVWGVLLVYFVHAALFGLVCVALYRPLTEALGPGLGSVSVAVLTIATTVVLPTAMLYWLYAGLRFRFEHRGLSVQTFHGRVRLAWDDVTRAVLERSDVETGERFSLRLVDRRGSSVRVPLGSFRYAQSLAATIAHRISVPVEIAPGVDAAELVDRAS